VINEFTFKGPFLKLGQNIGLLVGAVFSGVGSDIWGRRYYSSASSKISRHEATYSLGCPSFNLTLFITGVFALSGGASPNSITLCSWRCGALEWVVTFLSILLSFWVCQVPQLAYLSSLVDCLWDFNYRIYTRDPPISTDGLVCLVGLRFLFPHHTGSSAKDRLHGR
jgi:hypothetical protein